MREYTKTPQTHPHTLGNNPKAYNQAPTNVILQRYNARSIQLYATDDDEELLQGKFENTTQFMGFDEDEETLQGKFDTAQREFNSSFLPPRSSFNNDSSLLTSNSSLKKDSSFLPPRSSFNRTGLPDNLKTGIENLSGYSMDDVKVHYNSSKPAQLQALAYTQGTDIHVAPGQEKHLPHEAWHVVQQKQGRVQPTMQLQSVNVNDNERLEKEADKMGQNCLQYTIQQKRRGGIISPSQNDIVQRLQLIACEKNSFEDDLTVLNNIVFAKNINKQKGIDNEKVCSLFDDYNENDIEDNEIVFVHGHGVPGFFRDCEVTDGELLSYESAAAIIINKLKIGKNEKKIAIRMLSCEGALSCIYNKKTYEGFTEYFRKNIIKGVKVISNKDSTYSYGTSGKSYSKANEEEHSKWQTYWEKITTEKEEKAKKKIDELKNQSQSKDDYYTKVLDSMLSLYPFDFFDKYIDDGVNKDAIKEVEYDEYES